MNAIRKALICVHRECSDFPVDRPKPSTAYPGALGPLPVSQWVSPELHADILAIYAEGGVTYEDVARMTRVSAATVGRRVRRDRRERRAA